MSTTKKWLLMLLIGIAPTLVAQESGQNIQVIGRVLLDGALYQQNEASRVQAGAMNDGVGTRDIRLGAKAAFDQWEMKAEVGLNNNILALKDVYLLYTFSENNSLRMGNALVPFGLQSAYGTLNKDYMEDATADVYEPLRRIGITHTYYTEPLWVQYGVFTDAVVLKKTTAESGPLGYMAGGRLVWRPVLKDGLSVHGGISGLYVKPESIGDRSGNQIAYRQSHLTAVDNRTAVSLYLVDALHETKGTAEALLLYKNIKLASQFYYSHVWRREGRHYNTHGLYVTGSAQLLNPSNYRYNMGKSCVARPDDNALELTLGYGYLNLWDKKWRKESFTPGMMHAGLMQDLSVGLNYFWNKHVTIRANFHHVFINDANTDTRRVNVLQGRLQYSF